MVVRILVTSVSTRDGVTVRLVVVFTLIQGTTLPYAARRLRVGETEATREVSIESAPLEKIGATLLQFALPDASGLPGVYVSELRLPGDAVVTFILRDGRIFVPDQDTALRAADHVLLATSNHCWAETEQLLRAVSRAGRLAGWHGESGPPGERAGLGYLGSTLIE